MWLLQVSLLSKWRPRSNFVWNDQRHKWNRSDMLMCIIHTLGIWIFVHAIYLIFYSTVYYSSILSIIPKSFLYHYFFRFRGGISRSAHRAINCLNEPPQSHLRIPSVPRVSWYHCYTTRPFVEFPNTNILYEM